MFMSSMEHGTPLGPVAQYVYRRPPDKSQDLFSRLATADDDDAQFIFARAKASFAVLNRYPYNAGHSMVVPCRACARLDELSPDEAADLWALVNRVIQALETEFSPPRLQCRHQPRRRLRRRHPPTPPRPCGPPLAERCQLHDHHRPHPHPPRRPRRHPRPPQNPPRRPLRPRLIPPSTGTSFPSPRRNPDGPDRHRNYLIACSFLPC
ncbi:MAG: HIT domain-containing protein [Bdellovibrionaceae bacterium]|nr:HIT domain-containing protein [Pseudobdellovibrionaceae bacterium]